MVSKGAKTFPASPTHSEHSVEGPLSLQLAAKRISIVVEKTTIHEAVKGKSMFSAVSPLPFEQVLLLKVSLLMAYGL